MCSATAPTAAAVGSMLVHASRVAATASRRSHSSPAVCKHADRVPRPLVCRSFLPSIARRPAHADGLLHDEWADGASGRATFHAPAVGRARVARVCGVCSRRACMGVQIRSEVACEHVCRFRLVPRRRSVPQSVQNRCPACHGPSGRRLMPRRGRSHGCVTHVVCSGCEVGTAPWIVASRGRPLLETKPLVCVEFILSFSSTQSHRPTNLPVGNSSMSPADLVLSTERGLSGAAPPAGYSIPSLAHPQRSFPAQN